MICKHKFRKLDDVNLGRDYYVMFYCEKCLATRHINVTKVKKGIINETADAGGRPGES